MSKRKNRTMRAAKELGLNPYGWGNSCKKNAGVVGTTTGVEKNKFQSNSSRSEEENQDEK